MRRQSKKTAELTRRMAPIREAWVEEVSQCMCCEMRMYSMALEVHEILRGAHRQKAMQNRECCLVLCRVCHQEVQDWPLAKQLALKLMADKWYFDLDKIREVKGRGRLVDVEDIRLAAKELGFL